MTRYISLAEYLWLAEQVTGLDAEVFIKAVGIPTRPTSTRPTRQ